MYERETTTHAAPATTFTSSSGHRAAPCRKRSMAEFGPQRCCFNDTVDIKVLIPVRIGSFVKRLNKNPQQGYSARKVLYDCAVLVGTC
jgi:hypothetical protein